MDSSALALVLLAIIAVLAIMIMRQHRLHGKAMLDIMEQSARSISRITKEAEQRVLREKLSARVDQALLSALIFGGERPITADSIQEMSRRARDQFGDPLHERAPNVKLDEMAAGFELHERAPNVKLDEMAVGFEDRPPYGENENDRIV